MNLNTYFIKLENTKNNLVKYLSKNQGLAISEKYVIKKNLKEMYGLIDNTYISSYLSEEGLEVKENYQKTFYELLFYFEGLGLDVDSCLKRTSDL